MKRLKTILMICALIFGLLIFTAKASAASSASSSSSSSSATASVDGGSAAAEANASASSSANGATSSASAKAKAVAKAEASKPEKLPPTGASEAVYAGILAFMTTTTFYFWKKVLVLFG